MSNVDKLTRQRIIAALRKIWSFSEDRKDVIRTYKVGPNQFQCAACGNIVGGKDFEVDHHEPVVLPEDDSEFSFDKYIERLFCDISNLSLICKSCHKAKTQAENQLRRKRDRQAN